MEHSNLAMKPAQFAAFVSNEIDRRGISLRRAATDTGIPLTTLHRKLGGRGLLDIEEIGALARLLECTPSSLMEKAEQSIGKVA